MLYFDHESGLPFHADVVWKYLTSPDTYTLWVEGLLAVEPQAPLACGTEIALSVSAQGRTRKIRFDVTVLSPPTESAGHLAFEGRLGPEGLLLGTILVARAVSGSRVTVSLELARGHTILSMFDRPFGFPLAGDEQTLQMKLERAALLFRNLLEVQTADPYRGRA